MQEELTTFVGSINDNQITMLILTNQPNFSIFNYLQMIILKSNKNIVISYLIESIEHNMKILKKLISLINNELSVVKNFEISKEQLAYLMLNIPGLIEYLTTTTTNNENNSILDNESSDISADIDAKFQEFISKYPTIYSILNSNEFNA
ncbi:hypothetical protein KGF54_004077 [Candida jiufengensis]|uniref:uncharacterized protein n=1 Tax=Candida jiufengensis TaxID=497108 RepID=UPI002224DB59|nr:uncharacterized protein KGF54_004077 [Candida jiufengensis]KAI5951003.1 hypothetical protein KGF54_004077 [Candida jiufengensis]